MTEREYVIILNEKVDFEKFNRDMIDATGEGFIPNRSVTVARERETSKRLWYYMLTQDEVNTLKQDPRVLDIEIPVWEMTNVKIGHKSFNSGNFRKTNSLGFPNSSDLPWTIGRSISTSDPYEGNADLNIQYGYALDGTGVDVVIQDGGLDIGHIEFTDENGNTRVNIINWYNEAGFGNQAPDNHDLDYDGHGTHVAGTAVGRTMGFARNAQIYHQKVAGLDGGEGGAYPVTYVTDPGDGTVLSLFDFIRIWHNNKPIDSNTGYKRPTVVNMSWGYFTDYTTTTVTSVTYRGTTFTDTDTQQSSTYRETNYGLMDVAGNTSALRETTRRIAQIDAEIDQMIDDGIHVCIAAGNNSHYIDIPGGQDYDNYLLTPDETDGDGGPEIPVYYNRGSSPFSSKAVIVGNLSAFYNLGLEQKAESSCCGPGVDIYTPGTAIISASSDDNGGTNNIRAGLSGINSVVHPLDNTQRLMKISGTSMASPNIAGILACLLQANPGMTPKQAKDWLINNSTKDIIHDDVDWTPGEKTSIKGGNNRIAYMPYQQGYPLQLNNVTIESN